MNWFVDIFLPAAIMISAAHLLIQMGQSGGRGILSKKYRTSRRPKTGCCSGHIFFTKDGKKWIPEGINGFACDDEGFYLIQTRVIGFGLPSLHIPWQDIFPNGSERVWLRSYLQLKVGKDNSVLVLVPKSCEDLIHRKTGSQINKINKL